MGSCAKKQDCSFYCNTLYHDKVFETDSPSSEGVLDPKVIELPRVVKNASGKDTTSDAFRDYGIGNVFSSMMIHFLSSVTSWTRSHLSLCHFSAEYIGQCVSESSTAREELVGIQRCGRPFLIFRTAELCKRVISSGS